MRVIKNIVILEGRGTKYERCGRALLQDRFYAKDGTETATPGYLLLGASAGTDVVIRGKTRFSLYLIGSNLTDTTYSPHLSRLKYIGIYNMGRNVTFKLVVPF